MSFREVGVWRCEVVDDGAGISTNDQRKVFGEFVQFRKNELQAGGFINFQLHLLTLCQWLLRGIWPWFVDIASHHHYASGHEDKHNQS